MRSMVSAHAIIQRGSRQWRVRGWVGVVLLSALVSLGQSGCPLISGFESIDHVPPTAVTPVRDFRAQPDTSQVELLWQNPDTEALAGVRIRRSAAGYPASPTAGDPVFDGLGSMATDTPLTPDTLYYYAAFAYDRKGRYAAPETAVAFPSQLDTSFGAGAGYVSFDHTAFDDPTVTDAPDDPAHNDAGTAVTVDDQGRIVVVGTGSNGADLDAVVWRLNADGTPDTTFGEDYDADGTFDGRVILRNVGGTPGDDFATGVVIDRSGTGTDGYITVVGSTLVGTQRVLALWRLDSYGKLDVTFDADGLVLNDGTGFTGLSAQHQEGRAVALDATGKILVAGNRSNGSNRDMTVWRFTASGTPDVAFVHDGAAGGNGDDYANAILVESSGTIVVAGASSSVANLDAAVWRLMPDLKLDTTFSMDGVLTVDKLAGNTSKDDVATSIALTDTGYVVAGYGSNGTDEDLVLFSVKRSNGSTDNPFGTGGKERHHNAAGGNGNDRGNAIVAAAAGGPFYVVGASDETTVPVMRRPVLWRYTGGGALDEGNFGGDKGGDGQRDGYVVLEATAAWSYGARGLAAALDTTGRLVVTGTVGRTLLDTDMIVWRYQPN